MKELLLRPRTGKPAVVRQRRKAHNRHNSGYEEHSKC